jgi:hypothetical protein
MLSFFSIFPLQASLVLGTFGGIRGGLEALFGVLYSLIIGTQKVFTRDKTKFAKTVNVVNENETAKEEGMEADPSAGSGSGGAPKGAGAGSGKVHPAPSGSGAHRTDTPHQPGAPSAYSPGGSGAVAAAATEPVMTLADADEEEDKRNPV